MELSARNQLKGEVGRVKSGTITCQIRAARYRVVQLHRDLTGRVRRPAAHRALGRNYDGLVCAYRPHTTPALLRAKARRGRAALLPVATSNGDML